MTSPHDALFKRVFSQPEHAAGELRHVLPDEVVQALDWSTLRLSPGSFVDEELRDSHADLLYTVEVSCRRSLLYLLLEHKSRPTLHTPLQLYRYIGRIWESFHREHPGELLPAIIPIVVHHSRSKWTSSTELLDTIDLDPELRNVLEPFLPSFRFFLDDLTAHHVDAIVDREMTEFARLVLCCLAAFGQHTDLLNELKQRIDLLRTLFSRGDTAAVNAVLWYALKAQRKSIEDVRAFFAETRPMGEMAKTTWEQMEDVFEVEKAPAIRAELLAEVLLGQLTQKFTVVPPNVEAKIRSASAERIRSWLDRLLPAETLDDVFAQTGVPDDSGEHPISP